MNKDNTQGNLIILGSNCRKKQHIYLTIHNLQTLSPKMHKVFKYFAT